MKVSEPHPHRLAKFSPLDPRKVTISHLPPPDDPEEIHAQAPLHEQQHGLKNFLYRTFMLPLVGLGFFVPVPEIPALPPGQIVQMAPGSTQKAADTQHLDAPRQCARCFAVGRTFASSSLSAGSRRLDNKEMKA